MNYMRYGKKCLVGDIICAAGILLLALLVWIFPKGGGDTVRVQAQGNVYTYPLEKDTEVVLDTPEGSLTLVIENGYVYVSHSDCRDGICKKTGKINSGSIICLPLKVYISVEKGEIDEIAG